MDAAEQVVSQFKVPLARSLAPSLGDDVTVENLRALHGGASRQILAFEAVTPERRVDLVLTVPHAGRGRSGRVDFEYDALVAAHRAGVPVPKPYARFALGDPGDAGIVLERLAGESIPGRILRETRLSDARCRLVGQTGAAAARLHTITPETLGASTSVAHPAERAISDLESILDAVREPHPVIEVALRRLRQGLPPRRASVLVHGDLRLGNLLVSEQGLVAVLDWELARIGDPGEDLGWMCARSWRFGREAEAALGLGTRDELLDAYVAAGGLPMTRSELLWWEALANARWATYCVAQTNRFLSGDSNSLELAAIGRRACEPEWDLLALLSSPSRGGVRCSSLGR